MVVAVPLLQPAARPMTVKAVKAGRSRRFWRRERDKSAVIAIEKRPKAAVRIADLQRVTGAVVCTVMVAVAGYPLMGMVSGSQVASEGSWEQVRVMEPVSPPAGVTVRV